MATISKVLIVEDEMISAHNLADNLTQLGYTITEIVKTGEAAIRSVECNCPDLILMDIQLKGSATGIDTAMSMRSYEVPVIYLTAFVDDATISKAAMTRPYGYLTKPAKLEDIKSTLEVALARSKEDARIRTVIAEEKRLNQLKSDFLAMLAHDLRTPLSVMLASLEIVHQYGERLTVARKQQHFAQMRTAIREMTQQLETVMTAEQIAHGALPFHPDPLAVVDFFREKIDCFQVVLKAGQSLKFVSHSKACSKLLDRNLLEHIVNNLVSNAIKYSDINCAILVELICEPTQIILTVKDHGIGMPQPFLEKLFQPFERAENVGSTKGTGIGLHIVKQAVETHQGQITVTSQEGVGSCFVVKIPCKTLPP